MGINFDKEGKLKKNQRKEGEMFEQNCFSERGGGSKVVPIELAYRLRDCRQKPGLTGLKNFSVRRKKMKAPSAEVMIITRFIPGYQPELTDEQITLGGG